VSNAEVVYRGTPSILSQQTLPLDINGDGITDFTIYDTLSRSFEGFSSITLSRRVEIRGESGAGVVGRRRDASALVYGSVIGSSRSFQDVFAKPVRMARNGRVACGSSCSFPFSSGAWTNTQNAYLGLKFQINGETHYGWARLSTSSRRQSAVISVKVTGFAYQTVPNQPILAGEMGQSHSAPGPNGGTLGELSRGRAATAK
jgi:hypothetical protein